MLACCATHGAGLADQPPQPASWLQQLYLSFHAFAASKQLTKTTKPLPHLDLLLELPAVCGTPLSLSQLSLQGSGIGTSSSGCRLQLRDLRPTRQQQ
jgi:hypothetical protein